MSFSEKNLNKVWYFVLFMWALWGLIVLSSFGFAIYLLTHPDYIGWFVKQVTTNIN